MKEMKLRSSSKCCSVLGKEITQSCVLLKN